MNARLKARRVNEGMSVQAFADQFGVAKQTVWSWEQDAFRPRPALAKEIADFFGCKVTDLFPIEDPNGHEVAA